MIIVKKINLKKSNNMVEKILSELKAFISSREPEIKKAGEDFSKVEFFGRILLIKFFQGLNLFIKKNEVHSKEDLAKALQLIPKYDKLLDNLLFILDKEKYISLSGNKVTALEKVESDELKANINNLENFKNSLLSKFPDMKTHFNLLDVCLSNYREMLCGRIEANNVMFPLFSIDLVKGIFAGNQMADYFNIVMADFIKKYVQLKTDGSNSRIKILEIGSGTGGTSIFVYEALRTCENIECCFTDVSNIFVKKAQKAYKEKYPFVSFKRLNIEEPLDAQGFELNGFDIIFASNVVHATKNIKFTLGQIHTLLKQEGILLLNEVTDSQDFVNLTFGLMDGWWKFEDKESRIANSPLLSIDKIKVTLSALFYRNTTLVTTSHQDKPDSFSQSLFAAEK
jgi:SAM-dependent methyltransferase